MIFFLFNSSVAGASERPAFATAFVNHGASTAFASHGASVFAWAETGEGREEPSRARRKALGDAAADERDELGRETGQEGWLVRYFRHALT